MTPARDIVRVAVTAMASRTDLAPVQGTQPQDPEFTAAWVEITGALLMLAADLGQISEPEVARRAYARIDGNAPRRR